MKTSSSIIKCAVGALGAISSLSSSNARELCVVLEHNDNHFDAFLRPLISSKNLRIQHLGLWNLRNLCESYKQFRYIFFLQFLPKNYLLVIIIIIYSYHTIIIIIIIIIIIFIWIIIFG